MFLKNIKSYLVPFVMASVSYVVGCEESNKATLDLIEQSNMDYNSVLNEVDFDQGSDADDSVVNDMTQSNVYYCGDNNVETTVRSKIIELTEFLNLEYTRVDVDHPRDRNFKSSLRGREFYVTYTPTSLEGLHSENGTGLLNDYVLSFSYANELSSFLRIGYNDGKAFSVLYKFDDGDISFSVDPNDLSIYNFTVPACGVFDQFYDFYINLNNQIGFNLISEQDVLESDQIISSCLINSVDKNLKEYVYDVQEIEEVILRSNEIVYSEYFDKELAFKDGFTYYKYFSGRGNTILYRVCPLITVGVDGVYNCNLYELNVSSISKNDYKITLTDSNTGNYHYRKPIIFLNLDLNANVANMDYLNLFVPFHCEDDLLSLNRLLLSREN
ncbi:hypothetical protein CL656_05515 [bacterium]|nr:hypothetical protein [bacterium]|tara:strand:- start:6094 stop:7248 length:1155 start_codon:yes stop_codon:yes gene_type:complete